MHPKLIPRRNPQELLCLKVRNKNQKRSLDTKQFASFIERQIIGNLKINSLNIERTSMLTKSLYERLGGYDGIVGFVNDLLPRLQNDSQLGRFWKNRGDDGIAKEKQLLIDYVCASAGGPMLYTGRNMTLSHKGMGITESDWDIFLGHAGECMQALKVPEQECGEIAAFVSTLKNEIIEP